MLKHPKGLYILAFTEFWERFSFYGMKTLLIFYLTKHHFFQDDTASEYVGNYAALVYALPVLGGYLADKYLGFKKAIFFGAILLILGHLGMAFEGNQAFYQDGQLVQDHKAIQFFFLSMAFIIMGVGFLKPNISSIVGSLYTENDPRRDSGFTIFYMGINAGSLFATILCPWLGDRYGWGYGFGAAGVGMILGLITFSWGKKFLKDVGEPTRPEVLKIKVAGIFTKESLIYILGIAGIFVCWQLVKYHSVVGALLIAVSGIILLFLSWYMAVKLDKVPRERMLVLIILFVAAVVYFAFLEQQFISLNLFADRMMDRTLFNTELPAGTFLSLNALFVLLFGPVFAFLWIFLSKRNKEPNIPAKFGWGIIQAALGFGALIVGMKIAGLDMKSNMIWLVLAYLLVTTGELCVSPVGLSSVTKLSPKSIVGFMMGTWFLASAASEYLAAVFSKIASTETVGGEIVNYTDAYNSFLHLFYIMLYMGLGIGLALLIASPFLRKWMHGVK